MRIISGLYKGRTIDGYQFDTTRPTLDRVKESLFAMINSYIQGSLVLDLFAGSGSFGIEAISNGAKSCIFNDCHKKINDCLKNNLAKLKITNCEVYKLDYLDCLRRLSNQQFDLIFLDPPYNLDVNSKILNFIYEHDMLSQNGLIICEVRDYDVVSSVFRIYKQRSYGKINLIIYQKK